jgi:hypothetical protein
MLPLLEERSALSRTILGEVLKVFRYSTTRIKCD